MNAGKIAGPRVIEHDIAEGILSWVAVLAFQDIVIDQIGIFKQRGDGIEAEAGHTALEPEGIDVFKSLADFRIIPIQVGLLDVELVIVVLVRLLIPFPG